MRKTHKGGMNLGHEELDELLLDVEDFVQPGKAGGKDVAQAILVEEAREAGIGALQSPGSSRISAPS